MTDDELLDVVADAVFRYFRRGEVAGLLAPDVLAEAIRLGGESPDDFAVLMVLNRYHEARGRVLPPAARAAEAERVRWSMARAQGIAVGPEHPGFLDQETRLSAALVALGIMTDEQADERVRLNANQLLLRAEEPGRSPADRIRDLEEAVGLVRRWIRIGGEAAGAATRLRSATCLVFRHELTGDPAYLRQAWEAALDARGRAGAGGDAEDLLEADLLVGRVAIVLHQVDGGGEDLLILARRHLAAALASDAAGPDEREQALLDLVTALQMIHRLTGDPAPLQEAARLLEAAVVAARARVDEPAGLGLLLGSLGVVTLVMGEEAGDGAIARRGAALLAEALDHPFGEPLDRVRTMVQHANAARVAAYLSGELTPGSPALEKIVRFAREAVRAAEDLRDADPLTPGSAHLHLANALLVRHQEDGDLADLDEAETAMGRAVERTPRGNASRPGYLMGHGIVAVMWCLATQDSDALDRGLERLREALRALAPGHPMLDVFLTNLARALHLRYERDGRAEDLSEALEHAERAVRIGGERAGQTGALVNRAVLRVLRYLNLDAEEGRSDSATVLSVARAAVGDARRAISPDRAAAANIAHVSAVLEEHAHLREGDPAALSAALAAYRVSARSDAGPLQVRATAAYAGGLIALRNGLYEQSALLFEEAIGLLEPMTEPNRLGWESRALRLEPFADVGRQACAALVAAGRYAEALQILDRGRGVLLGPAWGLRSAVEDLPAAEAVRYRALLWSSFAADRLASADPDAAGLVLPSFGSLLPGSGSPGTGSGADHRRNARAVRKLLEDPAHRRLNAPVDLDELASRLVRGAVVAVNVTDLRSDALIVTAQGIETVHLPELTEGDAARQAELLLGAVRTRDHTVVTTGHEVVEWLWDKVVGPVMEVLDARDVERVWWIPTGPLSLLPLHAAGHHREVPRTRTVLDRVVSSYSATLDALLRDLRSPGAMTPSGLFVAPGSRGGLAVSTAALPRLFTGPGSVSLPEAEATRANVLERLGDHAVVHFSCHGRAVPDDPAASHLRMADGPLRFTDVARLDLRRARLAFLAACETAAPGGRFADQAIHLGSAFQLAGFSHVIGTLWEAYSGVASEVTATVYALLAGPGDEDDGVSGAGWAEGSASPAEALHQAVRLVRDSAFPNRGPLAWAPYVHVGP
ncbi:CHAT domain-containing protein [Streptomyces sp. NPDC004779]